MAKANDPLAQLNEGATAKDESMQKEIESLRQTVSRLSNENEALRLVQSNSNAKTVRTGYAPDEAMMKEVWKLAYQSALQSIFGKGLSYWNTKGSVLKGELQLAVIRADEALENYISARRTFMDPATKELQDFEKAQSTNPLAK